MFGGGGSNMAQANSSAQREPSMEEILASIRRIIEDSDAAGASSSSAEGSQNESEQKPAEAAVADRKQHAEVEEQAATSSTPEETTDTDLQKKAEEAAEKPETSEAEKPDTSEKVLAQSVDETDLEKSASRDDSSGGTETVDGAAKPHGLVQTAAAEKSATKPADDKQDESFKSLLESADAKLNERSGSDSATDQAVSAFRKELADDEKKDKSSKADAETKEAEADTKMSALNLSGIEDEVARQTDSENESQPKDDASNAVTTDKLAANVAVLSKRSGDNAAVAPDPVPTLKVAEPEKSPDLGDDRLAALAKSIASGEDLNKEANKPQVGEITKPQAVETAQPVPAPAAVAPPKPLPLRRDLPPIGETETKKPTPTPESNDMPVVTAAVTNKAPIISEQAGRQVAAAFDELSEAFSQTRKKSFDEMAEEMMRPMLQDWLDNNLPVLVERLVREEIDRVARGDSRQ